MKEGAKVAYKGSGKKARKQQKGFIESLFPTPKPAARKSKKQTSTKVHGAKGKQSHGRGKKF